MGTLASNQKHQRFSIGVADVSPDPSVSGRDDITSLGSAGVITVSGEANYVALASSSGSTASFSGTGNTVSSVGNTVLLSGEGSALAVDGANVVANYDSDEAISLTSAGDTTYTAAGVNDTVYYAASDFINAGVTSEVVGTSNQINLSSNSGSTLTAVGAGNSVDSTGNIIFINGTGSTAVINGVNEVVVNGQSETLDLTSAGTTLYAGAAYDNASLYANSDTLNVGQLARIVGANDQVNVAANSGANTLLNGTGININSDGNTVDLFGQGSSATVYGNDTVTLNGSGETLNAQGADTIYIADNVSGEVIYSSNAMIHEGAGDSVDIIGSGDYVYGDATDVNAGDPQTDLPSDGNGDGYGGGGGDGFGYYIFGEFYDFAKSGSALTGSGTNVSEIAQYDRSLGALGEAKATEAGLAQATLAFQSTEAEGASTTAVFEGPTWQLATGSDGSRTLSWSFADSPGTAADPFSAYIGAQYQAVVEQAIQAWSSATGIKFQQVVDSPISDIRIGYGNFDTQSSGVLGFTSLTQFGGVIQTGAIVRLEDPTQTALTTGGDGQATYAGLDATLYQVVLHEIGHALGFADNADPDSVMFATSSDSNRTLDQTDLNGAQILYGAASVPQSLSSFAVGSNKTGASATAADPGMTGVHQMVQAMASFAPQSSAISSALMGQNAALEQQLAAPLHH